MALLDDLGGRDAMEIVVTGLFERIAGDAHLRRYFSGASRRRLEQRLVEFLCAYLGDQLGAWHGRDLRAAHAELAIGDVEFDAFVELLLHTLRAAGVGAALIAAVRARLEPLRRAIAR